jgi:hypothetical protein
VVITPKLPAETLTTTETRCLKFAVLSDTGNKYARKLGIVWKIPESLRPVFKRMGNDLESIITFIIVGAMDLDRSTG